MGRSEKTKMKNMVTTSTVESGRDKVSNNVCLTVKSTTKRTFFMEADKSKSVMTLLFKGRPKSRLERNL